MLAGFEDREVIVYSQVLKKMILSCGLLFCRVFVYSKYGTMLCFLYIASFSLQFVDNRRHFS